MKTFVIIFTLLYLNLSVAFAESAQDWSKKVKSKVPTAWVLISEKEASKSVTNPLTWGNKGSDQLRYLLDAKRVNASGDWLVVSAYIRKKPYKHQESVKTEYGYVSVSVSIYNFEKMQAIYDINLMPEYRNSEDYTISFANRVILEKNFEKAYINGAKEIKEAINKK